MSPVEIKARMLSTDILRYIIRPTLKVAELWSPSAEILIYGTGLVESNYNYLMQIGAPQNGGIGFFQIQPSDYFDMCKWLKLCNTAVNNKRLHNTIISSCYYEALPLDEMVLASNIKFAVLMCRVHYLRIKKPLPEPDDVAGLSMYHKVYYNSLLGKADAVKNEQIFRKAIIDSSRT